MTDTRIQVEGEDSFNEREWLRREVLWGSLMAPYPDQMNGWLNGLETSHYFSNSSRQKVYAEFDSSAESQSKSFFNQGKVIGGILSSATVLRASLKEEDLQKFYDVDASPNYDALKLQAKNVDIVLGNIGIRSIALQGGETASFSETERMAKRARNTESQFARWRFLLRSGKIMSGLAIQEVSKWRETAAQNEEGTLPTLIIPNGGTPRSAGPRVEKLQPVFHEIVCSERFQKL
jgi:hypothetical protein